MRSKRGQKPNTARFQSLGNPTDWMQLSGKTLKEKIQLLTSKKTSKKIPEADSNISPGLGA